MNQVPKYLLDAISARIVLANARRMSKREFAKSPNWVLAMNVFGLGSTYANELCRFINVDPDAKTALVSA